MIADFDRTEAVCRDKDPELWFPLSHAGVALAQIEYVKSLCRLCPVRSDCLEYALETDQRFGIWGGYDMETEKHKAPRRVSP